MIGNLFKAIFRFLKKPSLWEQKYPIQRLFSYGVNLLPVLCIVLYTSI